MRGLAFSSWGGGGEDDVLESLEGCLAILGLSPMFLCLDNNDSALADPVTGIGEEAQFVEVG